MSRDLWGRLGLTAPDADLPRIRRLAGQCSLVAVASWAVYLLTTAVVAAWPDLRFDVAIQDWVETWVATRGPVTFVLAHLGSALVLTPVVSVACAYYLLRRRSMVPAAVLGLAYGLVGVLVTITKTLLRRPEPSKALDELGYAYPSGHTAAATVTWGGLVVVSYVLSLLDGQPAFSRRGAYLAGAAVVVLSVVMLVRSAHWLTDITGGIAIGSACLATTGAVVLRSWLALWSGRSGPDPSPRRTEADRVRS